MTSDIPELSMRLREDGGITFVHGPQARAYLRALFKKAGAEIVAQFYAYRAKRTSPQNRAAHALIAEWIAQAEQLRGQTVPDVKQWLLSRVFGWHEIVDTETGEVIRVLAEPHTSKLSVGQFCEFIEAILELAAGTGVLLMAPDEYRRAKEAAAKQAARAARKAAA